MALCFSARSTTGLPLLAFALLSVVGCQNEKPTGTVTGSVKYRDEPVTGGSVNLISATGVAAQAPLDEKGEFRIDAPLEAGEYKVFILPPIPGQLPPGSKAPPPPKFTLPGKFREAKSSGVTIAIKAGPNDIPILLKD